MTDRKLVRFYIFALGFLAVSLVLGLKIGVVADPSIELLVQLRIPRVLLALSVGMGLAVSGAVLQALFSNPLCEPYTLGISSGAAAGAVLGSSFGLGWSYFGITGSGFLGAALMTLVLYLIARRERVNTMGLLLIGVVLGFFGSSLVALWMAVVEPNGLHGVIFWLLGDLSRARLEGALVSVFSVLFLVYLIWKKARYLDALLVGEEHALALGVSVKRIRQSLIIYVSVLVGICVSSAGMIGFVGLVIPHFVRKYVGSLHLAMLPLSAIWGAIALILSDVLARKLLEPVELPVGVVTALVGAPLFLWVFLRIKGGYQR